MGVTTDVIYRAELLLDDRPHGIDLTGDILHAAVRRFGAVDVWFKARPEGIQHMRRSFQVVGTGQPIPPTLDRHHKTAISPDGQLVWHVLECFCPHQDILIQAKGDYGQGGECKECGAGVDQAAGGPWIPR